LIKNEDNLFKVKKVCGEEKLHFIFPKLSKCDF